MQKLLTLKNLKAMSHDELEVVMCDLREQINTLCKWGYETDGLNFLNHDARDLATDKMYLDTKHDLIEYIRKADRIIMKGKLMEAMLNFSYEESDK